MTHTVEVYLLTQKIEQSVSKFLAGDDESEEEEEERNPMIKEALVSLPITSIGSNQLCTLGNLESLNMQAEGIVCLQSIVYDSPPDIRRRRRQQWPAEVSRFQKFCMELYKPKETGFDMLALMLKYSPRSWHQSEKHRRGLKSIAVEHRNSFFKYASSVSSANDLLAWQLAFNYHATRHNLGLELDCTSDGQLYQKDRPMASKRKRTMAPSDEKQEELPGLHRSSSTGQQISDGQINQLKIIYESLCAQTKAPNQFAQQSNERTRNERRRAWIAEKRYPTVPRCGRFA